MRIELIPDTDSDGPIEIVNNWVKYPAAKEPLPVDSTVYLAFRITGYDYDCDGSLMARLEQVNSEGKSTGWSENAISLFPDSTWQKHEDDWDMQDEVDFNYLFDSDEE